MAENRITARIHSATQSRPATRLADIGHRIAGMPRTSPAAVRMIEDSFVDILGCVLSGNRTPEAAAMLAAAGDLGDGPAPVLGTGARLAPPGRLRQRKRITS